MADLRNLNVRVSWVIRRLEEFIAKNGDLKVEEMKLVCRCNDSQQLYLTYVPHQKSVNVRG